MISYEYKAPSEHGKTTWVTIIVIGYPRRFTIEQSAAIVAIYPGYAVIVTRPNTIRISKARLIKKPNKHPSDSIEI